MARKLSESPLLVALTLLAGVLAACSASSADEPSLPPPESKLYVTPNLNPAPPDAVAWREVLVPIGTPAEAANVFASALVTGNLTAATASFAPSGLDEARRLIERNGVQGISHFNSASVRSLNEVNGGGQWDVVFTLSSSRGESQIWTRWHWFEEVGWRIAAVWTRT